MPGSKSDGPGSTAVQVLSFCHTTVHTLLPSVSLPLGCLTQMPDRETEGRTGSCLHGVSGVLILQDREGVAGQSSPIRTVRGREKGNGGVSPLFSLSFFFCLKSLAHAWNVAAQIHGEHFSVRTDESGVLLSPNTYTLM